MPSVPAAAARASAAARAAASADTRSVSRPCNAHAQPRARSYKGNHDRFASTCCAHQIGVRGANRRE
jgi:hypothetical protein